MPRENEAFSDVVLVLMLTLYRFFEDDRNSGEFRHRWRRLRDLDRDKLLPDASAFCKMHPLDMTGFIEAFVRCNPEYVDLSVLSRTEISDPIMSMDDAEAVEILRGLTTAKTGAKN